MIAYETPNTIYMVNKIEQFKLYDNYLIRFNDDTIYKSYETKEEAELNYNELCKYLKQDKLIILKRDDD